MLPRIALLIAAGALLILALVGLCRGAVRLMNVIRTDGGALEPDPMFPQEEGQEIEYPAELRESGAAPELGEDPSLNWVYEELTPVERTAEELAREEQPGADGTAE